ncbi:pyridoxine/pyridoxamine 5'-phosphate oxidase [Lacicoccus alkaliphilus]|uniref:Pyridoxamine 5'-phosphate oxidase n=1 Tax=Lacicoccus alkaliphilus DSM 16010 TaxID=1123231 RepID=A0A1M7KHE9_9BACL|nr:pyridoxal 5'-phosphate synthase [Salinicoccus alkaliphilus]SHM64656.1 Pyridoxamine 5'-phosphate oxidase [Salinicoccus alkaliphilus DSM 16010]
MNIKALIYQSPALSGDYPDFDTTKAPEDPFKTFYEWFEHAVKAGVLEPSAFVFSTADTEGEPSARIVNLRDMTPECFIIGSNSESRKGRDLEGDASVAMTFYWRETGRQIRITGRAEAASEEENRKDFLHRHPGSRALSLTAKQSESLGSMEELKEGIQEAEKMVEENPDAFKTWTLYKVIPSHMEFFQARKDLAHVRLKYEKVDGVWQKHLLWP